MYRRYYFEVLDTHLLVKLVESPSFSLYAKMESVLENSVGNRKTYLYCKDIVQHFKEDLDESELLTELKIMMVRNMHSDYRHVR